MNRILFFFSWKTINNILGIFASSKKKKNKTNNVIEYSTVKPIQWLSANHGLSEIIRFNIITVKPVL